MISNMNKCIIIAEAGVNHNGDFEIAKKLVDICRAPASAMMIHLFILLIIQKLPFEFEQIAFAIS